MTKSRQYLVSEDQRTLLIKFQTERMQLYFGVGGHMYVNSIDIESLRVALTVNFVEAVSLRDINGQNIVGVY